ncbi:unnamed protein product [Larinioides sclopetarius]|uniref:Calx-beta domain-containing protein n=1 Tax=Larinioides sclopetarius TaxID=280406 RepID=A0AAV2BB71_9ARAC
MVELLVEDDPSLKSIAFVNIIDNDNNPGVFQFRENQLSVREGSARVSMTIIRSDGTDGSVSLRLRAVDGSARLGEDYTIRSSVISFGDGEREKSVDIDIIDDNIREGAEHFKIGLFDPTNGAILGQNSIFAVTILDDDGFVERPSMPTSEETKIFFTENSVMVPRGSPVAKFKIRREGDWIPLKVFVETLDGTARAGVDYKKTMGEVQFKPNEIELTVTLNLIDNPTRLGVRSFQVRLSNPSSGVVVRGKDILTVFIGGSEGSSSESKLTFHQQFQSSISSSGRRSGSINSAGLSAGVSSGSIQLPPITGSGSLSGQGQTSTGTSGQSSLPALPPPSQGQRRKIPQGQQDCAPGLIFNSCFFGCPQVCNLVADPVCNKGCTPACVCPKGLILESLHSTKCVPPSQCPRGGGSGGGLLGGGGGVVSSGGVGGGLLGGGGGRVVSSGAIGGDLLGGGGGGLTSVGGGRVNVGGTVSTSTGGGGGRLVSSGGGGGGLIGGLLGGLLGGGGGGLTRGSGKINVGGSVSMNAGGSASSGGLLLGGLSLG